MAKKKLSNTAIEAVAQIEQSIGFKKESIEMISYRIRNKQFNAGLSSSIEEVDRRARKTLKSLKRQLADLILSKHQIETGVIDQEQMS